MSWSWQLRSAAWILSLCLLLTHCRLHVAAPLSLGEGAPPGEDVPANEIQVRSLLPKTGPGPGNHQDTEENFFQDVATLLLQALHIQPEQSSKRQRDQEGRFRSETQGSEGLPETQQGQPGREPAAAEETEHTTGWRLDQQEMESLEAALEALQSTYSSPAKREEDPDSSHSEVLQELEEYEQLRVNSKRAAPLPSEPWTGARKLRQQQHLEHQLLQRRYEELAESRRQAEEARRAAAEEERLADMASDLLLQYLLKDGEEEEGANDGQGRSEEDRSKGSSLLFEDEESNVAEDKRSNEAPETQEEEAIDPSTIDRLIELSSKLHLPADDVVDIINDVEEKKKKKKKEEEEEEEEEDVPEPSAKSKSLAAPPQVKSKKVPPYRTSQRQQLRPAAQKLYYPPVYQPYLSLPKGDEAAWNEVLRGDEYLPAPKWYRAKPISNYISPRTFEPLAYHHHHGRRLPAAPLVPQDEYYINSNRVHDEALENYLEGALKKRPKVFQ